nr:aldo/keto reductase [Alkaliphilus hydrothermalis]
MEVSRLCFGGLTMGPLQSNMSPKDGGALIIHGFEKGINFIDTAELYETYHHIREALKVIPRDEFVIATKSYAYSKETAEESLKKAMEEMAVDMIDVFLLHEQENEHTLRGHYEALEYFIKMKEKGYIKAVGLSTHHIAAVKASLKMPEIEVLHPIVNINGLGIQDGNITEMLEHLKTAHHMGKGIYAMKPLGGGNLLRNFQASFDFVLNLPNIDSIAVGMQNTNEIDINVGIFQGQPIDGELMKRVKIEDKKLNIAHWCEVCGKCLEGCSHQALKIVDNKLQVDHSKCVLCGYCSKHCPQFCIKVV